MIVRVKTLNNHLRCRQALKSQPGASLAACKLAFVRSSLAGALILSSTSRGCYFVRQSVFGNPSSMLQEALNTYIRTPNAHEGRRAWGLNLLSAFLVTALRASRVLHH